MMLNSFYSREVRTILLAAAVLCIAMTARAQNRNTVVVRPANPPAVSVMVVVDGKIVELESAELVRSQQVMVWLRDLEKAGWGTVLPGTPEQILFQGKNVTLTFNKGQDLAMVNSLSVRLPVNTYSRDGKFMVPLSFVAKALGYDYDCSYRPIAVVTTSPARASVKPSNTLRGRITYNGIGAKGVRVRVTDEELNAVRGADAVTDANGDYTISGIPDGIYTAYVYIKDNPSYFNRRSEKAVLGDGKVVHLKPITLGRLISPLSPKVDETVIVRNGKIGFAWTECEGAASYKLVVRRPGSHTAALEAVTAKSSVQISAKRFVPGAGYEVEVIGQDARQGFLGGTAGTGGKPWTFSIPAQKKAPAP